MCGIYGSSRIYSEETIRKKLQRIAFRGPDYSEYVNLNNKLILGHNRLAILDLDPRSNQPFRYGPLTIVFNGEIYNFLDIKNDLELKGYDFRTSSDTEVICAAYLAYAEKCLGLFNGMFSFVIHDSRDERLFGARDRIGKKPFYYTLVGGEFEFASQISVIALGGFFKISANSVNKYLLRGYVEDPYSIFDEIFKLKAGHAFYFDLNSKQFDEFSYWDIAIPVPTQNIPYEEAKSILKILLEDSVKLRMISDVPIGTFLSGGVDSSLVTALAAKEAGRKINAFSIKFHNDGFDESEHAGHIANHLGINHNIIPCDYQVGIDIISELPNYFDEPFADSSAIPSMLLARETRKYMTVALSGDGGDEVFMGYSRYNWIRKIAPLYRIPFTLRKGISTFLFRIPGSRNHLISGYLRKRDLNELINDAITTNYRQILLEEQYNPTDYEYILNANKTCVEQKIADLDLKLWLCNDGLVKIDRATMAASMEGRCPLLDYRIVEFGRSLPVNYRYTENRQKKILKDILYEYVPQNLVDRPKKGFTMPFREWFKNELKEYVFDLLNNDNLKLIPNLNISFVNKGVENHMNGNIDFYPIIWRLIVLINWLKYPNNS